MATMKDSEEYQEGWDYAKAGGDIEDCPYPLGSLEYVYWMNGFQAYSTYKKYNLIEEEYEEE